MQTVIVTGASLAEHGIAAAEFGANNIRVNTIAPGVIDTSLHAKAGALDADSPPAAT
jgi:NAD(P)-dependent dehydrogenase (short-subunit alcohol dehydrogenase family)